jgi:HlyD family secretion protein
MAKKSKSKTILILVSLLSIAILASSLSGCQVISRFTGSTKTVSNSAITVETFTVKRGDLIQSMSTTGTVDSAETKNLSVKATGEVLESTTVGSQVKKGDILLKVDNSDLLLSIKQSQINVEVAESSLKQVQISYKAALDANHIAVQVAQLENDSAQKATDEAQSNIENVDSAGNAAIENATLALKKAQDTFNYSIAQAQLSLDQTNDQLSTVRSRDNSSVVNTDKLTQLEYSAENANLSYNSAVASATSSLNSATALLYQADEQARNNSENNSESAQNSYEQALISQSKTYWNTISSLEQAKQKIQSAVESISSSQKQVELAKISLETASKDLNNNSIVAPFDGIILVSAYNKGENAANTSTAITIASSDFLVKSSINETDIAKAAVGNKVTLSFDSYPDQEFEGEIASISGAPTLSNNITSYAITVKLKNSGKLKLFYGLTTNLVVVTAEAKNALIIPVQAVYTENGKQYVDVIDNTQTTSQQSSKANTAGTLPNGIKPSGTSRQRTQTSANSKDTSGSQTSATKKVEITTGINNYTYYEVLTGLKEGDIVITSSAN